MRAVIEHLMNNPHPDPRVQKSVQYFFRDLAYWDWVWRARVEDGAGDILSLPKLDEQTAAPFFRTNQFELRHIINQFIYERTVSGNIKGLGYPPDATDEDVAAVEEVQREVIDLLAPTFDQLYKAVFSPLVNRRIAALRRGEEQPLDDERNERAAQSVWRRERSFAETVRLLTLDLVQQPVSVV